MDRLCQENSEKVPSNGSDNTIAVIATATRLYGSKWSMVETRYKLGGGGLGMRLNMHLHTDYNLQGMIIIGNTVVKVFLIHSSLLQSC